MAIAKQQTSEDVVSHILHLALAIRNRGYTNFRPPTRTNTKSRFSTRAGG
ncbi:hypothetical protein [Nostoc sp.]